MRRSTVMLFAAQLKAVFLNATQPTMTFIEWGKA